MNLEPTLLHALDENRNDVRYNWFHRRFWRLVAPVHGGANECRGDGGLTNVQKARIIRAGRDLMRYEEV